MAKCIICDVDIDFPLTCTSCNAPLCDTHHLSRNGKCDSCTVSTTLTKLRRSGLATYETCAYLFKLTYIDEVEGISKSNLWAEVGNILHDIFERDSLQEFRSTEEKLFEDFMGKLDKFRTDNPEAFERAQTTVKDNIYDKMVQRGLNGVQNYLKYQEIANPIYLAEQYVEVQLDEDSPIITATIDRINKLEDGEFEIVDYKTGKTFYGKQLSNDLQPPIYLLGAEQILGKLPTRFTFVFSDSERLRTYVQTENKDVYSCTVGKKTYSFSLHETKKRVKRIFTGIKNEQFNIPSDISNFYCENFCNAFYNNLCEGGQRQLYKNHW
jgi:RecB family exonuclease